MCRARKKPHPAWGLLVDALPCVLMSVSWPERGSLVGGRRTPLLIYFASRDLSGALPGLWMHEAKGQVDPRPDRTAGLGHLVQPVVLRGPGHHQQGAVRQVEAQPSLPHAPVA